ARSPGAVPPDSIAPGRAAARLVMASPASRPVGPDPVAAARRSADGWAQPAPVAPERAPPPDVRPAPPRAAAEQPVGHPGAWPALPVRALPPPPAPAPAAPP